MIHSDAPLPVFDGISSVKESSDSVESQKLKASNGPTSVSTPSNTKIPNSAPTTSSMSTSQENVSNLVITPEENERYTAAFIASDPLDGYITGRSI